MSEGARLALLRKQSGRPLLTPPSLAHLIGPDGTMSIDRQPEALVAWQRARENTTKRSAEAAEELYFLTFMIGNLFVLTKDLVRHRAMLESALEAFFLPRHRSSVAADLCCAACTQGDRTSAEAWLALCEPASDDLTTDSNYRIARARVCALRGDYQGALAVLGEASDAVPFDAPVVPLAIVRRADALEHLGRVDEAVAALAAYMSTNSAALAHIATIASLHGICTQSYPLAAAKLGSEVRHFVVWTVIISVVLAVLIFFGLRMFLS
jgi:hypothetical protein